MTIPIEVPAETAALLQKCEGALFGPAEWRLMFARAKEPETRALLEECAQITPALVSQLGRIPQALQSASICNVASTLLLSEARWAAIGQDWQDLEPDRRVGLLRRAQRIRSRGDFFDFVQALTAPARDAQPFERGAPALGAAFTHLATPQRLKLAGEELRNDLGGCISNAASGVAAYYLWRAPKRLARPNGARELVTLELARFPSGWFVGAMEGARNQAISKRARAAIHRQLRASIAKGELRSPRSSKRTQIATTQRARGLVSLGRARFSENERGQLETALLAICSFAINDEQAARCVWTSGDAYLKFHCEPITGTCLIELSSHHAVPPLGDRLEEETVALLSESGFLWPEPDHANFALTVPLRTLADCKRLAAFACGVMHAAWDHQPGEPLQLRIETEAS
jgi:hypothetical protein